jgi:hypothetical protein
MKKFLSIAALFLMGMIAANAQDDKQVSKMMDQLQQGCQMTPDQAAKVKPMVQSFVSIKLQNKKQYADDKPALKAANETNRKNLKANLLTVLSSTQMGQYEAYVKQQREEKKGMNSGSSGNDQGEQQ